MIIFQETISAQREEEGGGREEEDGTGLQQPEEVSVAHAGGVGQEQELRGDAGGAEEAKTEEESCQRRRCGDEEKERVLQGLLQVLEPNVT